MTSPTYQHLLQKKGPHFLRRMHPIPALVNPPSKGIVAIVVLHLEWLSYIEKIVPNGFDC